MFSKHKDPQVLVVGAGPVGLFAALCLKRRGIPVRVVDEQWRTSTHSYALALHPESLRLLERVGALSPVLESAYRVRDVSLFDGRKRRARMHLGDVDEDFSFVSVTRQDVLESTLERALNDAGVKVDWNHRILCPHDDQGGVRVTLQKLTKASGGYAVTHNEWLVGKESTVHVPFVIGADGHRSLVRRGMEIEFEEVAPPLHVAVFEFATDLDLGHELRVVLDDEFTNVMWPMPGGYCRWSFQLPDTEVMPDSRIKGRLSVELGGRHYPFLETERLHELLRERAPWFDGSVDEIRWRMAVRFENRLASSFGRGCQWLAGDAAHMTGPVGGQSMNTGLREAWVLTEAIADVLQGGSSQVLASYPEARLQEWRFLLGLEGGLEASNGTDPWIAERSRRLLPCLPATGADLHALAEQVGLTSSYTTAAA